VFATAGGRWVPGGTVRSRPLRLEVETVVKPPSDACSRSTVDVRPRWGGVTGQGGGRAGEGARERGTTEGGGCACVTFLNDHGRGWGEEGGLLARSVVAG